LGVIVVIPAAAYGEAMVGDTVYFYTIWMAGCMVGMTASLFGGNPAVAGDYAGMILDGAYKIGGLVNPATTLPTMLSIGLDLLS
jgi:hypothetical protein